MSPYSVFEFTIPAAGVIEHVQANGQSIIILDMPAYTSGNEPTLSFDNPGGAFPLIPQSTYNSGNRKFSKLVVTGTAESAGAVVTVLVTNECLPTRINENSSILSEKLEPGESFTIDMNNTVQTIPALSLADAEGNMPKIIYASCRGGNVAFAYNADPTQGASGTGHILLDENPEREIQGNAWHEEIRLIAAVADETPRVTITPGY